MVSPITKPPVNILLVDDQPAKLLSYESVLGELGENLVRANSGNEALDLLLRQEFAVVLVDVVMPELDGFELAKLIRSHPRFQKTAIILVSGVMVEDAYRLKGYNSGAVDYISVPIVPEILRAKVAVFAELYRKTNELEQLNRELERRVAERTVEIEAAAAAAVEARREAERANQLKDEFLATLSHELRTPLNAITGWTHLLISGGLDAAEQVKAFDVIQRNALAQARLMADLLDVSRIVSGKLRLDLQPLDLSGAVEAALESLRPTAAAKQIQVGARLTPGLKPVQGDQVRLQQVIWNLLSNAVKFTPEGGHVELSLKPTANNHGAELSVADDGPGIPPEFLPFIFDRFRQSDHSSTRSQRGLGLGLTIVRHLVEAHGGYVTARNRSDGPGAIFTAVFPLAAAELPLSPGSSPPPFVLKSALHRARVLVVDDEADAREVVARILDAQGAEVMVAASAAEAMVILKRELPNVVVSDIEMPGEDGYDLVRQIRALSRRRGGQTPVAALTAYAGAHDRIKLLEAGFQEHIPKPVQAPELIRIVAMLAAQSPQPVAARSKG